MQLTRGQSEHLRRTTGDAGCREALEGFGAVPRVAGGEDAGAAPKLRMSPCGKPSASNETKIPPVPRASLPR